VASESTGASLITAGVIVGASILVSAFVLKSSIDRGTEQLEELRGGLEVAAAAVKPAAPTAQKARSRRPDPNRRYKIDISGRPVKGGENAKVTIVEWSDFQCPFCRRVTPTLEQIHETYGDQVRVVFRHLPLSIHSKAPAAHAAAEAAHKQGKFWEMHDKIFENQRELSAEKFTAYATELGLDVDQYKKDVVSAEVKKRVDSDSSAAATLGVTGTPAFFVNGRYLSGAQPFASFKKLIDEELDKG
jgi:protein-disulfide isomerase